ncbi:hypothetical protein TNCV_141811 [Trichonephila clavipes]|nr:hypothetical protein TNCV_141811 [Trichonephila clavipes]
MDRALVFYSKGRGFESYLEWPNFCTRAIGDGTRSFEPWTRTTPELAPSSSNFHTTPTGGHLSLDRFNVHQPLYTAGLQQYQARAHAMLAKSP